MRALRLVLGACGVVLALVGVWQLRDTALPALVNIAVFLAGGVVLHDFVIGPLVLVGALVVPRLPGWCRAPVAVGLVVLLSVTLAAVPVLGRFGVRPDVPSLLPRPYAALWLVFAALVVLVVAVASVLRHRGVGRSSDPSSTPSSTADSSRS